MKIIENWQYRYIEKSLYNYDKLNTHLVTEKHMKQAIDNAMCFFKGTPHIIMIYEYYINMNSNIKKQTKTQYFKKICEDKVFTAVENGYVIRREIIYKIAMNCYALQLFNIK